ncbi:MAG: hypothetical protein ACOCQD_02740 [archaeon]
MNYRLTLLQSIKKRYDKETILKFESFIEALASFKTIIKLYPNNYVSICERYYNDNEIDEIIERWQTILQIRNGHIHIFRLPKEGSQKLNVLQIDNEYYIMSS